jgi:diguanylate cyclase (GGDEF)-like protein
MSVCGITTSKAGKVLAVNCDPEIIRILEVNLTHANLEVISAENGAVALLKAYTEKPDIILLDPSLPDVDGMEFCQRLKKSQHSSHIPVIIIGAKNRNKYRTVTVDGAIHDITKPFDPQEVVALVQAYLKRKERSENINPLTGLPNKNQVSNEITELIEQKKPFAAIYIAMDNLRSYNKVYGYSQGDRTIRLLADIICEAVRLFGNPDDLVGHLGGDKFVVITTHGKSRSLCRRIIADFNGRVKTLYTNEDLQRGHITYESPLGREEQSSIMCLRIAVVTNQKRSFCHHLEVSEVAAEQLAYLRHFPGSNCYFDLRDVGVEPDVSGFYKGIPQAHRKELRNLQGVLVWLAFLTSEIDNPITAIDHCLNWLESKQPENRVPSERNMLATIRQNINQLLHVTEGLESLITVECPIIGAVPGEVNLRDILYWIKEQVRDKAEQQGIMIDIQGVDHTECLMVDGKGLAQSLLYLLRAEVELSSPGDRLHIRVSDKNPEFINIRITNPNHHIPQWSLEVMLQGKQEVIQQDSLRNELYPAKILVQGLGGKIRITSKKGKGINYTVIIPKRWQSWIQEINALLFAVESSRKEARAELNNIERLISSLVEKVPITLHDSLDKLRSRVQELGVLCNRSLFLAEDFDSRLEIQQDRLIQQENEQLATSEAVLTIGEEIARAMNVGYIFDLDSAKRVVKYSLTIAKEFRLSEIDRQALLYAALLKDLGLALSPHDMVEQMVVPTIEEANSIRARFNLVWKALSTVPFLSQALVYIMYRYEKYDGTGSHFGVKGADIPLGARILAIADTFDSMTSGLSPQGTLDPMLAVQKIADDSGIRFDPNVVNAFSRAWRRKELYSVSSES